MTKECSVLYEGKTHHREASWIWYEGGQDSYLCWECLEDRLCDLMGRDSGMLKFTGPDGDKLGRLVVDDK